MATTPRPPAACQTAGTPLSRTLAQSTVRRGSVLRDTATGRGLVFVDGAAAASALPRVTVGGSAATGHSCRHGIRPGRPDCLEPCRARRPALRQTRRTGVGYRQRRSRKVASEFSQKGAPVPQQAHVPQIRLSVSGCIGKFATASGWAPASRSCPLYRRLRASAIP